MNKQDFISVKYLYSIPYRHSLVGIPLDYETVELKFDSQSLQPVNVDIFDLELT